MFADVDWASAITLVLITALTPGPNNLSCASMGVSFGFRRSRDYLLGIGVGITIIMLLAGWLSNFLRDVFPTFEPILRVVGAFYILYLAYQTVRLTYDGENGGSEPLDFKAGVLLQFLNPKLVLFGLTLYTAYLLPLTDFFIPFVISALVMGARGYLTNVIWVLFGSAIRRYLSNPVYARVFNIAVALVLVYSAADLLGLPDLICQRACLSALRRRRFSTFLHHDVERQEVHALPVDEDLNVVLAGFLKLAVVEPQRQHAFFQLAFFL